MNCLDYKNKIGEFSIINLDLNNFLNKMIKKTYKNDINKRKVNLPSKCGDGICLFQNRDYAENSAGIIDLFEYRFKIILMYRVNPNKIR